MSAALLSYGDGRSAIAAGAQLQFASADFISDIDTRDDPVLMGRPLRMRPRLKPLWILAALLLSGGAAAFLLLSGGTGLRRALETPGDYLVLEIQHPIAGAVLPLNMPAPVI